MLIRSGESNKEISDSASMNSPDDPGCFCMFFLFNLESINETELFMTTPAIGMLPAVQMLRKVQRWYMSMTVGEWERGHLFLTTRKGHLWKRVRTLQNDNKLWPAWQEWQNKIWKRELRSWRSISTIPGLRSECWDRDVIDNWVTLVPCKAAF